MSPEDIIRARVILDQMDYECETDKENEKLTKELLKIVIGSLLNWHSYHHNFLLVLCNQIVIDFVSKVKEHDETKD